MREKLKKALSPLAAVAFSVILSVPQLAGCAFSSDKVIESVVSLQPSAVSAASSAVSSETASAPSSEASSAISSEESSAASSEKSSAASSKTSSAKSSAASSKTSSAKSSAAGSKASSVTASPASSKAESVVSSSAAASPAASSMTQSERWASKLAILSDPSRYLEMTQDLTNDFWDDDEFWLSGKVAYTIPEVSILDTGDETSFTEGDGKGTTYVADSDAIAALKNNTVKTRNGSTVTQKSYYDTIILIAAYELSPSYEDECLKAQMVASYTYLRYHAGSSSTPPTAGLASDSVQKSRWGDAGMARLRSLLDSVAGNLLTINGYPIFSTYGSINNGVTNYVEDVWNTGSVDAYGNAYTYLAGGIDSHWDKKAGGYAKEVVLSTAKVKAAILAYYPKLDLSDDPANWIKVLAYNAYGYALNVNIDDQVLTTSRNLRFQILSKENVGSANMLRSTSFTIDYDKTTDCFYISMTGYGHGVGLSQEGAELMAEEGYTWQEIVLHYFPGAKITKG